VARAWNWLSTLAADAAHALRQLRRNPGFAAAAVLSLGLGIAGNATVFSLVDAMWLRTLPVRHAESLVRISPMRPGGRLDSVSFPEYDSLRRRVTTLAALAAHYSTAPLQVSAAGESAEEQGAVVSGNYFSMLGVAPAHGRFFLAAEGAAPGRDPVAVISTGFWRRRFGGDATVLGREMLINGVHFRIVGVAPEEFRGVLPGAPANEIWIPLMMIETGYRWCSAFRDDCTPLQLIGRLAPGRTAAQAAAEVATLVAARDAERGREQLRRRAYVEPAVGVEPELRRIYSPQMRLLAAIAAVLLLLACANVAGLLIARSLARRREIAVRLSLGAGRARLIRQLVTESLVLALAGAALGVTLTGWTRRLLVAFYTTDAEGYHPYFDLHLDPPTLGFALALGVLTGVLFGLAPAAQAVRVNVVPALKSDASSGADPASRWRTLMVTAQMALSVVVLVATCLLVRSASRIEHGAQFEPRGVALMRLRSRLVPYPPARAQALTREVLRRIEAQPGVESVGFARGSGLVWGACCSARIAVPGRARAPLRPEDEREVDYQLVGPGTFAVLRIPLLDGRDFDARDRLGSPAVAVVNQTLAARIEPHGSPLGRLFQADGRAWRVVGVVRDAQFHSALAPPPPFFYLDFWQSPEEVDARLAVRTKGDPRAALPMVRRVIAAIDPQLPVTEQMTLLDQVEGRFTDSRLAAGVMLAAGGLALLLSAVGLYGVIAYSLRQRRREIGLRMALGARRSQVLRLVLREVSTVVVPGIALGLAAAAAVTRLLGAWLYGVSAGDPASFLIAPAALAAAALLATWLPARRASRLDPAVALRDE
jgi:predicted permease